jgi:hypothetical protein
MGRGFASFAWEFENKIRPTKGRNENGFDVITFSLIHTFDFENVHPLAGLDLRRIHTYKQPPPKQTVEIDDSLPFH